MSESVMGGVPATGAPFRVGTVLGKTFNIFSRQFGRFLLLAFIPMAPLLLFTFGAIAGGTGAGAGVAVMGAIAGIAAFVLQSIAHGTSLYGAFQEMRGQPFTVGRSLQIVSRRILPIIGVSILVGLAVGLGTMLFVVPGLILLCMLYVAVPVCIIETQGVVASMKRSGDLTKGYRWPVFGIVLLVMAITIAGSFLLELMGNGILALLLKFTWQVVATSFGAVCAAVIYHDLRAAKEGIDVDRLASVFD